uniref:Putative secreted peptide n=1 Tax=Anopheles braziliensis TaxID=58242 RepID=A0A2M3ZU66_9DIPT
MLCRLWGSLILISFLYLSLVGTVMCSRRMRPGSSNVTEFMLVRRESILTQMHLKLKNKASTETLHYTQE